MRFTSQKRSDVALVTSSNSDSLIELGDRPAAEMTARLLLALTALYVQRPTHTAEEQQQYIELALRLIDKVEAATRTAVARILQRHPDAPAEVVERLDARQSSREGDPAGEPHHTRHQHSDRNPALADRECASTPTPSDAPAVWQLPPAYPPPQARKGVSIHPPLLAGEGREGAFGEAFFAASAAERRRLLSLVERGCVDDVEPAPEDSERRYGKVDPAAWPSQIGEFALEFGQLIDIPTSLWERILNDPSGEPMVVAAKATGMPMAILQRILLLVSASASYSVQRVYDLTELYHWLDGRAACRILALWRTQAKPYDPISHMGLNTADRRLGAPRPPPYPPLGARASRPLFGPGTPDSSGLANKAGETTALPGEGRVGAGLRARFGALTERLQGYAVNARVDRGSVARRGLRSR
jgi:hypothetical protein